MNERKESCPTKLTLLTAWHTAAEAYSKAVAELSKKIGMLPKPDYDKLKLVAEKARQRSVEAQTNLDAHIDEHGCDGEAAA